MGSQWPRLPPRPTTPRVRLSSPSRRQVKTDARGGGPEGAGAIAGDNAPFCCCLNARERCKMHNTNKQQEGGRGEGGGDKPSQTADRPKPQPNKNPKNQKRKHRQTANPNTPFGLRERTKAPQKETPETRGGEGGRSHAMYSKTMLRSNASEMIVKSSVVPETKTGKQRKQKKQPATAVVVVSRTAEKNKSSHSLRSQPEDGKKEIRREPNPRNNI